MGSQWSHDRVYARAVREGYRSRASYKLLEIQERFSLIHERDNVVDLGAAPGSWLQVARALTSGSVIGVDLSPIMPLEGVETIAWDITDPGLPEQIRLLTPHLDLLISDAAPKLSGQKSYDQARAIGLGETALDVAAATLTPGGSLLVKSFQGEDFDLLMQKVRHHFRYVKAYRTRATRRGSTEIYIIGKDFLGRRDGP